MEVPSRGLIGRDHELQALLGAFAGTRSGRGRSILLIGPEGGGAPALVGALRDELGRRGLAHRWRWTRGLPDDSAYGALASLLPRSARGTAAVPPSDTGRRGDGQPAGLENLLAGLPGVPVEARPAVVGERLAHALAPGVGDPPLVVAIERADALDPLASVALATTVRVLAGTPTLTLVTAGSAPSWPFDEVLRIGPLSDDEARGLAEVLAGEDRQRVPALLELSGRLPGRMVALSRWPDPRIPAAEQLAGLHPRAASLVLVAGLAEGHLGGAELLAVAGADPTVLSDLEARHVLRRPSHGPDAEVVGRGTAGPTTPDPWQQAAANATPPEAQRALADATARALDRVGAPARVRARALERAGSAEAARAWQAAAREAGLDADARATYLLHAWRALPHAIRTPEPEALGAERGTSALALASADALLAVGRTEEARQVVGSALLMAPRRDRTRRARLWAREHRALLLAGDHSRATQALVDAVALLPSDPAPHEPGPDDPDGSRATAEVMTLAAMAEVGLDPERAARSAERALEAAERTDDPASRAAALGALALARGLAGQPAADLFDAALVHADDSGDRGLEARIAANRIYVQWRAGDLAGMAASVDAELARLDRTGLAEAAGGQLLVARAVALHGLGRWRELTDHLAATLAHPERLGAQVELLLRLVALELAADLGRIEDARAGLADLQGHPAFADPEIAYEVTAVRLGIAALAGDLPRQRADDLVDEALALADGIAGDPFAAARVRVAALRLLASVPDTTDGPLDLPGRKGEPAGEAPAPAVAGQPAELRALLAEEAAWRSGGGWDAAITAWNALPMPYRRAWAQVWAARADARAGRATSALDLVDAAAATADDLGAVPLRAAAQRVARQLGRRSGRTQGALTARERDVLTEAARGRTNREIARSLGMSERTVAVHLGRIFAKLGAGTRGEAVLIARHLGEIA